MRLTVKRVFRILAQTLHRSKAGTDTIKLYGTFYSAVDHRSFLECTTFEIETNVSIDYLCFFCRRTGGVHKIYTDTAIG